MANNENLIPFNDLTEKERREMASKAGKASVEARRKKKTMREVLELVLHDAKLSDAVKENLRQQGIKEADMTHMTVIARSLVAKAEAGDVAAYNTICSMLGEKPKDTLDVSVGSKLIVEMVDAGVSPVSSEDEIDKE